MTPKQLYEDRKAELRDFLRKKSEPSMLMSRVMQIAAGGGPPATAEEAQELALNALLSDAHDDVMLEILREMKG